MAPDLELSPQVVQSHTPSVELNTIIVQAMFNRGVAVHYMAGEMGSAWFVEVPRFLEELLESVGEEAVLDVLYKLLDHEPGHEHLWDLMFGKPHYGGS
jgi:hypothetical protein